MDDSTQPPNEPVPLAQGPLAQMRELERVLKGASLTSADVIAPPGGCSG